MLFNAEGVEKVILHPEYFYVVRIYVWYINKYVHIDHNEKS
jgi:hypothetical protein